MHGYPILGYFQHEHLPAGLAMVSAHFAELAEWIAYNLADGPEKSVALRKLLEAKDAAVRAAMP